MLKDWQFNVLFFVGVGGAILLLVGPEFGFMVADNPATYTGVGAILTYVLAQKRAQIHQAEKREKDARSSKEDGDGHG